VNFRESPAWKANRRSCNSEKSAYEKQGEHAGKRGFPFSYGITLKLTMFCAAPLKLTPQVDLIPPLQEYLKKSYSKEVAEKQMKSCEFVNQTRNKAVAGLMRPDTSREVCGH
jgi:hypothetical protein